VGKAVLIGAGPGAADLITVRGARILSQASVVLYDALVGQEILDLCPNAIKIPVGKRFGQRSTAQAAINVQLVELARNHPLVVRLKGGDPMLFGRADEELASLEQAGIEVEVVPGISTAFAAAAATLQPLTKRGYARSVAFFTSSSAPDLPDTTQLPDSDTLVQYMGGQKALQTADLLLAQGRSADLPVLVVENCSLPNERIWRMTLADLKLGLPECSGPVLVMIGEAFAARPHPSLPV
jgi:uroporphyrin-III C-methyltransferase